MNRYLTSEYVGIGHPDKVADQISDGILDMYLGNDPNSRVAVETLVSGNKVFVVGEITSKGKFSESFIKDKINEIIVDAGYDCNVPCEFREGNLDIQLHLRAQSPNIHQGVDKENGDIGAGDQGIMFGYATNENTDYYLPVPYVIAADLLNTLNKGILNGEIRGLFTDNKSQVCCWYQNGNIFIDRVILSSFHSPLLSVEEVQEMLKDKIVDPVLDKYWKYLPKKDVEMFLNSAGPFFIGGPEGDSGLTGRKIIVDTYGGFAPHGGGAFSGKDPSKVDRSAAYMARHIAKSIVANGLADKALVQLSYAIGHVKPFSIAIDSDSSLPEEFLIKVVQENFDLSPKGIIDYLKLTDQSVVKYKNIAGGGHFLSPDSPWEQIKQF